MKVIAFNGSPKSNGNTAGSLKIVGEELIKEGIDFEIIDVGNKKIQGCIACGYCVREKNEKCVINDEVNEWIQKTKDADGLIFASPVYFAGIAGTMKCFLDRFFYVTGVNNRMLRHKVGTTLAAVRRSGGVTTFDQMNHYIHYAEMIIASSNYWNVIHGAKPGEIVVDEEGVQIMKILGQNMAWILKLKENGNENIKKPEITSKVMTNFVR